MLPWHYDEMASLLQTSSYQRVILIDTQVVLETKPLEQLPWSELGEGPFLLVVCRQVQSEIDAKKNDGRLGTRARSFNRRLDSFLESRIPVAVVGGLPRVDVALLAHARIDWATLDNLDADDGDDKIVAQALHALVDDRMRIELLSHDMRPRDAAITNGLRAIKLPEHWLREPEPSPDERERIRLERELRVLRAEQPAIKVSIDAVTPEPWSKVTIEAASEQQTEVIRTAILRAAPRPNNGSPLGLNLEDRDYSFDDRRRNWREKLSTVVLPLMHVGLRRLHAQHRFTVRIENVGAITAEGLSLEVRSGNAVLHSFPYYVLVFGSPAPYPRYFNHLIPHIDLGHIKPASRHEPFTFYTEEDGPGPTLTWSCSSFRQEKTFEVELSIEINEMTVSKVHIEAVVTARNLKGDVRSQLIVPIAETTIRFDEAIDPATRRLASDLPYDPTDTPGTHDDIRWIFSNGDVARKD